MSIPDTRRGPIRRSTARRPPRMHSLFYLIGLIVVILAVLQFIA
ncbi:hypothetical protein RM543_08735 [Roseicyclus sp. F158]|uniref:Uncharacterized protein n=1 Tax=Tropicimonas omnivorans TaxID=3075590 RepID=A0ABU3DGD9_9RHOB|nr:hypothetical protein [Roseicyclus sp. F158]MDT0682771.1 hypothetical protein [Roseicyclus sp. F158]